MRPITARGLPARAPKMPNPEQFDLTQQLGGAVGIPARDAKARSLAGNVLELELGCLRCHKAKDTTLYKNVNHKGGLTPKITTL